MPDPVDHHSCGEWVCRRGEPVCELQSTALVFGRRRLLGVAEDFGETAGNFLSLREVTSAVMDPNVLGFRLLDGHGEVQGWELRGEPVAFLAQRLEFETDRLGKVFFQVASRLSHGFWKGLGCRTLFLFQGLSSLSEGGLVAVPGRNFFGCSKRTFMPARHNRQFLHGPRALEDPGQCVVVGCRNRIDLVVVAPGATEGHPQECFADGIHLLIDDVHLQFDGVVFRQHFGANRQEAGGDQTFAPGARSTFGEQVAGDLFPHKLVVGFVLLERIHHVVPVPKGLMVGEVFVHPIAVAVTGDIQPVASPPLAVAGRFQESVHEALEGVRACIVQERFAFLGSRRKSGEIETDSPQERLFAGWGAGGEALFFQAGENKGVDGVVHPRGIFDLGHLGA